MKLNPAGTKSWCQNQQCLVPLTTTDIRAGYCTQCGQLTPGMIASLQPYFHAQFIRALRKILDSLKLFV